MKHAFCLLILLVSCSLLVCSYVTYAQVNIEWDKSYGGTEGESLSSIIATPDGGYLLAGSSTSDASGDKSQDSKGDVITGSSKLMLISTKSGIRP